MSDTLQMMLEYERSETKWLHWLYANGVSYVYLAKHRINSAHWNKLEGCIYTAY